VQQHGVFSRAAHASCASMEFYRNERGFAYQETRGGLVKGLDIAAGLLVITGALNWGLVAVARFDLVAAIFGMHFGETSPLTSVVYGLVGLAGAYQAITLPRRLAA
jgi:uncharacterized membrane protein YuzA (DUF378 family)